MGHGGLRARLMQATPCSLRAATKQVGHREHRRSVGRESGEADISRSKLAQNERIRIGMNIAANVIAAIAAAVIGGLVGFIAAYRQNVLNELRQGFKDLEVLRAAPSRVKWHEHMQPALPKIVDCPWQPGDDEWIDQVVSLKSLASILMDDELYGIVDSIALTCRGTWA